MANASLLTVSQVAEEYGKLFYIINPVTSSFSSLAECPDYVQQAMPYMVTLIILEAVVNLWLGKRHNLADSVTSISCGLLMTMVGLITKGSMISIYSWVHHHYRLVDLAWDSVITWVLAAVLVDLGYYWFHRASHEVALLWSVHQVHHSSEEFNLTTAFRQPVFQVSSNIIIVSLCLSDAFPGPLSTDPLVLSPSCPVYSAVSVPCSLSVCISLPILDSL